MNFLQNAVTYYRSTFSVLTLILLAGIFSYSKMPVEAQPYVKIPYASVNVRLEGVSPEDSARLLVRPLEQEIRTIANVEEIRAFGRESYALVLVKFEAGAVDSEKAINDLRVAVDRAKAELPSDADEPIVEELTADDFPSITVVLTPTLQTSERDLFKTAKMLQREIEGVDGVLDAPLAGHREEVVEAIIDPARLENYRFTSNELITAILGNNILVPAGSLDSSQGRFSIKVPGLIENYKDAYTIPLKSTSEGVITLGDVAEIRRTFKDPSRFSTYNGRKAILLEVNKRIEANQIEVAQKVRELVTSLKSRIPAGVEVDYAFDLSEFSQGLVNEMRGNIITAMALVMVIVVGALGFRSGILVGLGIPVSLLIAMIAMNYLDYSFNMMVMFGMMLALGMLIDGSIVITEFANRKVAEGLGNRAAYQLAVRRMFWPVMASTATTLAAFLPMMFWPGVPGQFMGYLPVTVFCVLLASLSYALFFAPVVGSLMKKTELDKRTRDYLIHLEEQDPTTLPGHTGRYARFLSWVLRRPVVWTLVALMVLVSIFQIYGRYNNGVTFFTDTEETAGVVAIRAQGNFSIEEKKALVAQVEQRVLSLKEVKSAYSASGGDSSARVKDKDEIGSILVELYDPKTLGRSTHDVFEEMNTLTEDMAGIIVSAQVFEGGPPVGKPIQLQLESNNYDKLRATTSYLRNYIENNFEGVRDVTDTTPLPGIEWEMKVNRTLAAQFGVNVMEVGRAVQLVTNGILLSEYRPDDSNEEVEIRVRYPADDRGLRVLDELRVTTAQGPVPISTFVTREAHPKVDQIERVDSINIMKVQSELEPGYLADDIVQEIKAWLEENPLDKEVNLVFRGANEEQEESLAFLSVAFLLALFLMYILLVTQFNSFYQAFLILSSVVMSTAGVLLGLLLTGDSFSTILTGVGIVALAGIVVNNNIVLIDTYNYVREEEPDLSLTSAAVKACAQRLRPVFLTTATTILGMAPIAMGASVDLIAREVVIDGVVASYFVLVARAIVFGLLFATLLTLIVTPVMLILPSRLKELLALYLAPVWRSMNPGWLTRKGEAGQ
ncbi:MAG: efflux RND transporter permease subunit [Candidatus Pelagadaptatus aseana]|uniref:efflux RND transporter permease subunit n=1 Tax=Candidatus Pelagadaptatus aseana TaxID=3120508 RepID=UPI0039B20CFD